MTIEVRKVVSMSGEEPLIINIGQQDPGLIALRSIFSDL
jgi:hypothetical protein